MTGHEDPFNTPTPAEMDAIGLARRMRDDVLPDALRIAMRIHVDDASSHDLRVLGARAFALARRRDAPHDAPVSPDAQGLAMSDVTKPPGGWLDEKHTAALRSTLDAAVRAARATESRCDERVRALAAQTDPPASSEYLARQRSVVALYRQKVTVLEETRAVFVGIEHGARVEALPSPEEERQHEILTRLEDLQLGVGEYNLSAAEMREIVVDASIDDPTDDSKIITAKGRATLDAMLSRPVTDDELAAMGWAMEPGPLAQGEAPDA